MLFRAWDRLAAADAPRAERLRPLVDSIRAWDRQADTASVGTTLFIHWYREMLYGTGRRAAGDTTVRHVRALESVRDSLVAAWGTWWVPWGRVNRIQRVHPSGVEPFGGGVPSFAVPNSEQALGMIAVTHTTGQPRLGRWLGYDPSLTEGTTGRTRYGVDGNSYVAVIDFAPRVRARSLLVFGHSADPRSPHFTDQAPLYARSELKEAWFDPDDVAAHAERAYHPGFPDLPRPAAAVPRRATK